MAGNQIRADFATLDQLAADQGAHAGSVEDYRAALKQQAVQALGNLDGGLGTQEHQECMRKIDELIDQHIQATQSYQQSTGSVNDTFMAGGRRVQSILGSGA
jgi:hypothetical protein